MKTKQTLKKVVSWILIVILMLPNIAFTAEPSNPDYITTETPNDTNGENQLNNLTLNTESEPIFQISVTDPSQSTNIINYHPNSVESFPNTSLNYTQNYEEGILSINSAENGRYAFIFSSNEADTYGYSKPYVFDIVDGLAYTVVVDDLSTLSTLPNTPVNPANQITGLIQVPLTEGVLIGNAYDHHGQFTYDFGHISIEKQNSEGNFVFVTDMAINADGSIAIPKEDGIYHLTLWPFDDRILDAETIQDGITVKITGGTVTDARDMLLMPVQVGGTILDPQGNPVAYDDYWVEIQDADGNHLMGAQKYFSDGTQKYFRIGRLPEGSYRIVALPNWSDDAIGVYGSEPIVINIDSQGIATSPSIPTPPQSDIMHLQLQLRTIQHNPIALVDNITNYAVANENAIEIVVRLANTLATSEQDIKVELLTGTDTEGVELTNYPYKGFWPESENISWFKVKYELGYVTLDKNETYRIRLTDTKKPVGAQTVEFPIVVTDQEIISYITCVGNNLNTNYQIVFGQLDKAKTYAVRVYDNAMTEVGVGTIAYNPEYKVMLMTTNLPYEAQPTSYVLDDSSVLMMNHSSSTFVRDSEPFNALWSVSEEGDNYVIKILNGSITSDNFINFDLALWTENGRDVKFQVPGNQNFTIFSIVDLFYGIEVTIPKTELEGNMYYSPSISFSEFIIGNEDLFFPDSNEVLATISLYDPTGLNHISDFDIWEVSAPPGAQYKAVVSDSKAYFDTNDDGTYKFNFFTTTNDTFATSEAWSVVVKNGVAYFGDAPEIPMPKQVTMNLQEGTKIGITLDINGNPSGSQGYLGVFTIDDNGNPNYAYGFIPKEDGSIYLPKEDGAYLINYTNWWNHGAWAGDEKEFEIAGGEVVQSITLRLEQAQLMGTISLVPNQPITTQDFNVVVRDAQGMNVKYAGIHYTNGIYNYKFDRLQPGDYTVQLEIYDTYLSQGYFSPQIIPIHVDQQGIVTTTASVDLKALDFPIVSMANEPLAIAYNYRNYVSMYSYNFDIDVRLANTTAAKFEDFKVELLIGANEEAIELIDTNYSNFWKNYENSSFFSAAYAMDVKTLDPTETYKIRITDTTKPSGLQTVEFPIVVTDKFVVMGMDYIGSDGTTEYHVASGDINLTKAYAVSVYDDMSNKIGVGTLAYDAMYKKNIMKTELQPGSQPVTYVVEDSDLLWMHEGLKRYSQIAERYQALWTVTELADDYVVKIYNESLTSDDLTLFDLAQWTDIGREVRFPNATYSDYTVTDISEFLGGIQITFPKAAIENNTYLNPNVGFGDYIIGNPDLFFANSDQNHFIATLYDPTGQVRLYDFEMWEIQYAPAAPYQLNVADGKVYFDTEGDGEYTFVLFTTGDDPYALSQPLRIKVVGGVAYWGETFDAQIPHEIQVRLQEGIKLGDVLDQNGIPNGTLGSIGFNQIVGYDWIWLGGFKPKANGAIYVPKIDGTYRLYYDTLSEYSELVGEDKAYEILNGAVTQTVNYRTNAVQFTGNIYIADNRPAPVENFDVAIYDAAGNFLQYARNYNTDGIFYYKVGGLAPGNYTYELDIYDYYVVRGYANGNPVPFTIEADGSATVAQKDIIIPKGTPQVFYSTTEPTRGSVTATLDVGKEVVMINADGRHHVFEENGEFEFLFKDFEGKTQIVVATVTNIDRDAPVITDVAINVTSDGNTVPKTTAKTGDILDITFKVDASNAHVATFSFGPNHAMVPMMRSVDPQDQGVRFSGSINIDDGQGLYDLSATVSDAAGNQTYQVLVDNFAVDNTPPVVSLALLNTLTNGYITEDIVRIQATSDGQIQFGTSEDSVNRDIQSLDGFLSTSGYDDGQAHTLYFKAVDVNGNASEIKALTFKWDNIAPTAPIVTIIPAANQNANDALTNLSTVELSIQAEAGALTIKNITSAGTEQAYTGTLEGDAVQNKLVTLPLREGLNTFKVKSIDAAGNFAESEVAVIRDSTAPIIVVTLEPATEANGLRTWLHFDTESTLTEGLLTIEASEVADAINMPIIFTQGEASYELLNYDGNIQAVIKVIDAAGNEGTGRFTSVNVSATQSPLILSEGITLQSGGFTLDSSEPTALNVSTFRVAAGDEQAFIGEPIQFALGGTSTVDPTIGVVVDIVLDELVTDGSGISVLLGGYPDTSKLNYFDESLGLWMPLDNSAKHGDSFYNSSTESIWVTVDPAVLNSDFIGTSRSFASHVSGEYEIKPGHILGFLKHFSGYAVLKDNIAPVVMIKKDPLMAPINAKSLTLKLSWTEEANVTFTLDETVTTEFKQQSDIEYVIDLEKDNVILLADGPHTFTLSATDKAGNTSSTETFEFIIDRTFEDLVAQLEGIDDGAMLSADTVSLSVNATDSYFANVIINEKLSERIVFEASAFQTDVALVEGSNRITVTAYDTAGNSKEVAYTITRDTMGPAFHLDGLNDGEIISSAMKVKVVSDLEGNPDIDLPSYDWILTGGNIPNNAPITGKNIPVSIAGDEGLYTLVVQGYDALGNMTRLETHFTLNLAAPEISASTPDVLSNTDQTVQITVSPLAANTAISIYKDGKAGEISSTMFITTEDAANNQKRFSGTFTVDGIYKIVVDTILGTDIGSKVIEFVIDKKAPEINVVGVVEAQTFTVEPVIAFEFNDPNLLTVSSKLTKLGDVTRDFSSGERITENGYYVLTLTAEDGAQNTTVKTIHFTVAIPVPEEPYAEKLPTVILDTARTQNLVLTAGQKVMQFNLLNVTVTLGKSYVTQNNQVTVVTVNRYKTVDNGVFIKMDTKKDIDYKLTSDIYKISTTQTLTGDVTIVVPYDDSFAGKENKLSIICYDAATNSWVLIKGKFNKANNTITFTTDILSYFMVVESVKSK